MRIRVSLSPFIINELYGLVTGNYCYSFGSPSLFLAPYDNGINSRAVIEVLL